MRYANPETALFKEQKPREHEAIANKQNQKSTKSN
jgi:hypothetical protein